MKRLRFARFASTSFVALSALLLASGCASTVPPKALQDANAAMARSEVAALEAVTPDVVREAKGHLRKAREAHEDGDDEMAELYAYLATLRLETARNLVTAQAARKRAKLMAGQGGGFGDEEDRLRTRQAELKRFDQLEARIAALQADLNRKPEGDSPDVISAKQALAKARRMQADAIGAGVTGTDAYRQGASLINSAVESLELSLYGDSRLASQKAFAAFETAMSQQGAPKAAEGQAASGDRTQAEDAIADANAAQATALAAGAPQSNPGQYQRAATLLGSAERQFDRSDYRGATRLAREAQQAFGAAGEGAKAGAHGGLIPGSGGPSYGKSLDDWIVEMRMKRAEMIGAGKNDSCPGVFKEFEAVLELAEERRAAGDQLRARELAIRADERLRRCELVLGAGVKGPSEAEITANINKRRATEGIREAQAELAKARARFPGDERLGPPETLLNNAERWFDRGDYAQAERLADQARMAIAGIVPIAKAEPAPAGLQPAVDPARAEAAELLERAQSLEVRAAEKLGDDARLKEPKRMLRAAEQAFDAKRYAEAKQLSKKVITELTKLETAGQAPPKDKALSPAAQRAADAIEAAREAKVKAEIALAKPADIAVADRLLKQATDAFGEGRFDPARLYAEKAKEQYLRLAGGAPVQPTKKDDLIGGCSKARDRLEVADRLERRTAGKHLTPSEREAHDRGKGLVTVGRMRLGDQDCETALSLANEAIATLQPLPTAPEGAVRPGEKGPKGEKPGEKPKAGTEPGALPGEQAVAPWRKAYDRTLVALKARDEARKVVTEDTQEAYDQGVARLAAGRTAYDEKRYDDAFIAANAAIGKFDLVLTAAGKPKTKLTAVAAAPKSGQPAAKPGAAPKSGKPAAGAKPGIKPGTKPTAKPPAEPWHGPYRAVFQALALRDKAEKAANLAAEKEALERGKKLLAQAQEAWPKKNYPAAGELAKLAIAEFQPIVDGALEPKDDPAELMRKADAALREAKVVLQICERDKCEERDFAELTRAKEALRSADEAFGNKSYPYAEELAKGAKDKLTEILARPRPNAPKVQIDPAQKQAADDALNEAEISRKLCESRSCSAIDLEAWLRAQQSQVGAKSAIADGQFDRAVRLAKQAKEAYDAIKRPEPTKPSFAIPTDVPSVTRSGSQLYLKPSIEFGNASAQLAGPSKDVVADLARVLVANQQVLERVKILGFTDNKGSNKLNKDISASRAQSVRQALIQGGVPAAILTSEGRGPADPIADNATPEGRQANRRVEIHFEVKQ